MSSTDFFSTYFLPFSYSFMFPCDKSFIFEKSFHQTAPQRNRWQGMCVAMPNGHSACHRPNQTKRFGQQFHINYRGGGGLCTWGVSPTHFPISPTIWCHFAKKMGIVEFLLFPSSTFKYCTKRIMFFI